jgi:hypothetical protein
MSTLLIIVSNKFVARVSDLGRARLPSRRHPELVARVALEDDGRIVAAKSDVVR